MPRFSWASFGLATTALSVLLAPVVARAEPSPTSVHVVQAGDTLLQIALDAGTDTDTILTLNGLSDANVLAVGQSLKLPAKAVSAAANATPSPSNAAPGTYTIAGGDNLWDIAQRFGTTTDAIVQMNHLDDPDHLSLGTVLSVPGGAQARPAPTSASTPSASTPSASPSKRSVMVSYTVRPGETLSQIAKQFSVQSDAIVQATSLDDANKLAVGTVLKVPVPAKEHVVATGETLRDIAASEKVDLGSLVDLNQIDDPALIRVGQVVLLPVAATQGPATASAPASAGAAQASAGAASPTARATAAQPSPAPTPAAAPRDASAPPPDQVAAAVPAPAAAPNSPAAAGPQRASASATPAATSTPAAASTAARAPATPAPAAPAAATPAPKPAAPAPAVPGVQPPGASSDSLASAAMKLVGAPYVWGGSTPSGFDCSGLVWYLARQLNKQVSRGMLGQYNSGAHPSRDDLKPGDLVFFQNTWAPGLSHNGIYIGNGKFVNAADETSGVTISSLNSGYWTSHWFGATRLP